MGAVAQTEAGHRRRALLRDMSAEKDVGGVRVVAARAARRAYAPSPTDGNKHGHLGDPSPAEGSDESLTRRSSRSARARRRQTRTRERTHGVMLPDPRAPRAREEPKEKRAKDEKKEKVVVEKGW